MTKHWDSFLSHCMYIAAWHSAMVVWWSSSILTCCWYILNTTLLTCASFCACSMFFLSSSWACMKQMSHSISTQSSVMSACTHTVNPLMQNASGLPWVLLSCPGIPGEYSVLSTHASMSERDNVGVLGLPMGGNLMPVPVQNGCAVPDSLKAHILGYGRIAHCWRCKQAHACMRLTFSFRPFGIFQDMQTFVLPLLTVWRNIC